MSISLTSPVTGAAQTGFASPTYTIAADNSPPGDPGKQYAVTALGGTQAGVSVHAISSPFTINFTRPASPKVLGTPNPVTGVVGSVPMNTYKVIVRKGVTPLAGQPIKPMVCRATLDVPAGSDLADPANIRAGLSLFIGALWQQSPGLGDTTISGTV